LKIKIQITIKFEGLNEMFRWLTRSLRPYVVRSVHYTIAKNYELDIGLYSFESVSNVTEQQSHIDIHNMNRRESWGVLNVLNSSLFFASRREQLKNNLMPLVI